MVEPMCKYSDAAGNETSHGGIRGGATGNCDAGLKLRIAV